MADRITFRTMAFGLVGFLFLVELTSGILQGYYVPLASKIAGHIGVDTADYNWTEAAQLLVSALVCRCSPSWATCSATSASCSRRRR